jgi:hypothetical protein
LFPLSPRLISLLPFLAFLCVTKSSICFPPSPVFLLSFAALIFLSASPFHFELSLLLHPRSAFPHVPFYSAHPRRPARRAIFPSFDPLPPGVCFVPAILFCSGLE